MRPRGYFQLAVAVARTVCPSIRNIEQAAFSVAENNAAGPPIP